MKDLTKECISCAWYRNGKCLSQDVKEALNISEDNFGVKEDFGCYFHKFIMKKIDRFVNRIFLALIEFEDKIKDPEKKVWSLTEDESIIAFKSKDTQSYCDMQLYIKNGEKLVCGITFGIDKETLKLIGYFIEDGEIFTTVYKRMFYV